MRDRIGLVAALALLVACSAREPGAAEPTTEARAESKPTQEAPLVTIELGLVGPEARARLGERHGPDAPIVTAKTLLAVRHRIAEPWHIYWKNPGDSGLRTRVRLSGEGFEAGEVLYPAPDRFVALGGQVSFGWAREVVLFVPLQAARDDAKLELRDDWLACHESCIPGEATIEVALAGLETFEDGVVEAMLDRLPEPAGERVRTRWADGVLHVEAGEDVELREFFPYASKTAILEQSSPSDGALDLRYRFDGPPTDPGQGVLAVSIAGAPRWIELAVPWPS